MKTTKNAATPPNTRKRLSDQSSDKRLCYRTLTEEINNLTAADIPSIVQSVFQSLSATDCGASRTAMTKSTTGTADSSTTNASSSNAMAKDTPSAASNANSKLQSQSPLTTNNIAAID